MIILDGGIGTFLIALVASHWLDEEKHERKMKQKQREQEDRKEERKRGEAAETTRRKKEREEERRRRRENKRKNGREVYARFGRHSKGRHAHRLAPALSNE